MIKRRFYLSRFNTYFLTVGLLFLLTVSESFAQDTERQPIIWRQLISGSTTVKSMFVTRSPQFILYRDGYIVYRNEQADRPYQHVQLTEDERVYLIRAMQDAYRLSGLTPNRLKREDPYIASMQKRLDPNNKNTVVIWMGMHNPPTTHRHSQTLLEARSGNDELGPAWNMLYECSRYLATFNHPRGKPLVPETIEVAVQTLPSYLSNRSDSAKPWPVTDLSLKDVLGTRKRGFTTLTGEQARQAYRFLSEQSIVSDGGTIYEVWVRPILLPKK